MNSFLYIAIIASGLAVTSAAVDCANDPCKRIKKQQAMCRFPDPKPSPACGKILFRGFSQAEKNEVVNLFNKYRQYVASGKEKRGPKGPQPPATDMQIVRWNNDLANDVQRTLDSCKEEAPQCIVVDGRITSNGGLIVNWAYSAPLNMNITQVYIDTYNAGVASMTKDIVRHYKIAHCIIATDKNLGTHVQSIGKLPEAAVDTKPKQLYSRS